MVPNGMDPLGMFVSGDGDDDLRDTCLQIAWRLVFGIGCSKARKTLSCENISKAHDKEY